MDSNPQSPEALEKQKQFFERARRGVLQYLVDQGGRLNMSELHDHSMKKFLIQHQRFSMLMEGFVDDGLVDFDWETRDATVTDKGRQYLQ